MSFDQMIEAMRTAHGDDDAELAAATQLRVRRSLESRAHGRRQLLSVLAALAVLFVGTAAWALATGQIEKLWSRVPAHPVPAAVSEPPLAMPPEVATPPRAPEV